MLHRAKSRNMIDDTNYIGIIIILASLSYIPGPGILLVTNKCMSDGLKEAILFSLGITMGHITLAIFFTAFMEWANSQFSELLILTKYLGAAFLAYLAIKLLFRKVPKREKNLTSHRKLHFIEGFLFTFVNPKALMVYVSIIPANIGVINPTISALSLISIIVFFIIGSSTIGYSLLAQRLKKIINTDKRIYALNVISATMIMAIVIFTLIR